MRFFFSEHDKKIHECATEIESLPVKPPYGEFVGMLTQVLNKFWPETEPQPLVKTNWAGRPDGHLGGVER